VQDDRSKLEDQRVRQRRMLHSELNARLADVATDSHTRQEQGSGRGCRNRGSLCGVGDAWSSPHS